jgi:GWxTD domain-containing protein
MRSRHDIIICLLARLSLLAGLTLLSVGCARVTPQSRSQADGHYRQGLELYRQGEPESAVWELEQAIRLDPDLAPAHDLLGRIYLRRGDIRGRWLATQRARRAVALAPQDAEYRFNLATIYRERGFGHSARREFQRVLEIDSTFWQAHYEIGLLHEEGALRYESAERHRKAAEAFARAARIAPGEYEVLSHLALNLMELERWEEADEYLQTVVRSDASRPQAHLLLGMAQHHLGRLLEAQQDYQAAIDRMTAEDRRPFVSLEYLATPEELEANERADSVALGGREPSGRGEFLRRFWKERDPTPTTPVNERWLEHCRRVAYANIHFAAPKLDLPGWQTKRGEFYIRYGEPKVKWRELGEISTGGGLVPPRWVWAYSEEGQEVSLIFADTFLNGEYNFPFPDKSWSAADFRNSPATIAERMVESDPEDYRHDYGAEPLEYLYRTVEFRGRDGLTELQVVYGIPNPGLDFSRSGQMARAEIERTAVLFDPNWNEMARAQDRQNFEVPPTQTANVNRMVVEQADFQVPPGSYWLALNIRDEGSGRLGIVKAPVEVDDYGGDSLAISSLVLANELISSSGAEGFRRGDMVVVPRLGQQVQTTRPLLLYYEIYGLHVDFWGRTWYRTEYTIARIPEQKGFFSRTLATIAAPFSSGKKWESISSSLESVGLSEMEIGRLQVDLSTAEAGDYVLKLTVTDMNSGQVVEREVGFVVVE